MTRGDIGQELGQKIARALRASLSVEITADEALIRPSNRPGVDYQCNVSMSLAKTLGRSPRDIAVAIVANLANDNTVEGPEIAGPGFINLVLRRDWLEQRIAGLFGDERVGVSPAINRRRIAIDYSSPNVAKEMHVGHLRSTIIGDAILRLLRFAGHEVVPHNHLGDWGTPFGMLIEHLADEGGDNTKDVSEHSIRDLNGFYQEARKKFDSDKDFAERARRRVVALQGGDQPTLKLWQHLVDESTSHFEKVYSMLGVELESTDIYGESFYNPYLDSVIEDLEDKGLAEISDGAVCTFPAGFLNRDGDPLPLIVRKRDGGYGYAATDLATARYWAQTREMTDLLYVVGNPQAQHFQMIFEVARQAGYLSDRCTATYIGFGTILGQDGKTIRTRAGGSLKLVDLLTEAVDNAAAVVAERSELDVHVQAELSRSVGIGAVKYADLSGDREKDYTFTWEKMLAKEGNTSVYLQYANARAQSLLRKAPAVPDAHTQVVLEEAAERALAIKLLQLPVSLSAAVEDYAPHKLCTYLNETASVFTSFYESCPILAASTPEHRRQSRLLLTQLTSSVLVLGLSLLGISAPDRL